MDDNYSQHYSGTPISGNLHMDISRGSNEEFLLVLHTIPNHTSLTQIKQRCLLNGKGKRGASFFQQAPARLKQSPTFVE